MALLNPYHHKLSQFSSFAFSPPSFRDPLFSFDQKNHWDDFFSSPTGVRPQKVILEVGCSDGRLLTSVAESNPNYAFIGMDWKFKMLFKAAEKAQKKNLKNIALLRADASGLDHFFGKEELDEVWIFFPDPWARNSQKKHRLIQERYLLMVADLLKSGGKICIKTDHPGYFQWIAALCGREIKELQKPIYHQGNEQGGASWTERQILMRKPMKEGVLPDASAALAKVYKVISLSLDYEKEKQGHLFDSCRGVFEESFVRQNLPIYFLELQNNL